jgi:hypothetical protein
LAVQLVSFLSLAEAVRADADGSQADACSGPVAAFQMMFAARLRPFALRAGRRGSVHGSGFNSRCLPVCEYCPLQIVEIALDEFVVG